MREGDEAAGDGGARLVVAVLQPIGHEEILAERHVEKHVRIGDRRGSRRSKDQKGVHGARLTPP